VIDQKLKKLTKPTKEDISSMQVVSHFGLASLPLAVEAFWLKK